MDHDVFDLAPAAAPLPAEEDSAALAFAEAMAAGHAMRDAGLPLAALDRYQAAARLRPNEAEAHAARGETLLELDRPAEAATAFEHARALDIGCAAWTHAHAEALSRCGRLDDAAAALNALLALRPGHAGTLTRLGAVQEARGDGEAALDSYREAGHAGDADAMLAAGRLLLARDEAADAIWWLQRRRRAVGDDGEGLVALARAHLAIERRDEATALLRRCLAADPEDGCGAAALLADIAAGPGRALPAAFVRGLFDQYAERFDSHLVEVLDYRGHLVAAEALAAAAPAPPLGRVLDLGCGTGLAGGLLRPLAAYLEGVDLSPRMADKARARGVYDAVRVGDMVAALAASPASWHAAVAADAVAYLGDLAPLFAAAAVALKPGGLFVATAEQADGDAEVALKPTRRFGHSESHIRAAAAAAGLAVVELRPVSARRERREPVAGWLFVLRADG